MRIRRAVQNWHLVKFCPPSACTGGRAAAVVDSLLECGHVLRTRHFGPLAYRAKRGLDVTPVEGWVCPVCTTAALHALAHPTRFVCG
jgi:hypothetical protein